MLCMLVRLYSYGLIMWGSLCITLAVVYIRIKVNVMRITLHIISYYFHLFCLDNLFIFLNIYITISKKKDSQIFEI